MVEYRRRGSTAGVVGVDAPAVVEGDGEGHGAAVGVADGAGFLKSSSCCVGWR